MASKNIIIALVAALVTAALVWIVLTDTTTPPAVPDKPGRAAVETTVPGGSDRPVPAEAAEAIGPPQLPGAGAEPGFPIEYRIRQGDTLNGIARRFYGNRSGLYKIIAAENDMPDSNRIRVGAVIRIPDPQRERELLERFERIGRGEQFAMYRVRAADTLQGIAEAMYGKGKGELAAAIARANGLDEDAPPAAGRWLRLPNDNAEGALIAAGARVDFRAWLYTVRQGDTLYSLSKGKAEGGKLILEINDLAPGVTSLEPGQAILVPDWKTADGVLARQ